MSDPSDFDAKGTPDEIVARLTMYAHFGNNKGYIGPRITPKAVEDGEAMMQADIRWLLRRNSLLEKECAAAADALSANTLAMPGPLLEAYMAARAALSRTSSLGKEDESSLEEEAKRAARPEP